MRPTWLDWKTTGAALLWLAMAAPPSAAQLGGPSERQDAGEVVPFEAAPVTTSTGAGEVPQGIGGGCGGWGFQPIKVTADFRATPRSGFAPLTVSFADRSRGWPASWTWEFGDGTASSRRNPVHTYSAPGSYTVSLRVANVIGSDTETKVAYIQVLPVEANFDATPRSGDVPLAVSFTDSSFNSPTSWSWDLGDGTSSNLQNPTHTYSALGDYTVSLTVTNEFGSDTETKTRYIDVTPAGTQTCGTAPTDPPFTWSPQALLARDAASADELGASTALEDDLALVGAPLDDHAGGSDAGSVYVFGQSAGGWSEMAKLVASDAGPGDVFGVSVALDGDRAIVGASGDDHAGALDAGSAYVFLRTGGVWTEETKLVASDVSSARFGTSVAICGDTAIVGCGGRGGGAAYVFQRTGSAWTEQARLDGYGFGSSVALDGDTALVGAKYAFEAYVFVRSGTGWNQQARLRADNDASWFGCSVALAGDWAIVGASREDAGRRNAGAAYAFVRKGTSWSQHARLTASQPLRNARFGFSVALDGNTALVGADGDDSAGLQDTGSVHLFVRSGASWSELGELTPSDPAQEDRIGSAVALCGDIALVGARSDDHAGGTDAGSAHVFESVAGLVSGIVTRNGSGVNPVALSADSAPSVGALWTPRVSTLEHAGATSSVIVVHERAAAGPITRAGELLVDLSSHRLLTHVVASSPGGEDAHPLWIPTSPTLVGYTASCQAAIFDGAGITLTNALDLRIGH